MDPKTTHSTPKAPSITIKEMPKHTVVTPGMFVFLSLITFGFYHIYWGWRAWETVRRSKGEVYGLKSSVRGWFLRFSSFSLFTQLKELASGKNIPTTYNVTLLGIIYLVLSFAMNGKRADLSVILIAILLSTLVLLPVVKTYNAYVEITDAEFTPSATNWWLITTLVVIYGSLFALVTLLPDSITG